MSKKGFITINITREINEAEIELEIEVEGTFTPGRIGRKSHPMDRFAEPDEPAEAEVISAIVKKTSDSYCFKVGDEIELTDDELRKAENKIIEAAETTHDHDEP